MSIDEKQRAARDRLIVGLDVPTIGQAEAAVRELGDTVSFYKINRLSNNYHVSK